MRLPEKDSATWKGIITAAQTFIAFAIAVLAVPEVKAIVLDYYPTIMPIVTTVSGVLAFVYGFIRSDVTNY